MRLISRIVNFVKIWVENYYHLDFHEHSNREALEMFIEGIEEEKLQAMLKTHINRKVASSNSHVKVLYIQKTEGQQGTQVKVVIGGPNAPKPILPKSLRKSDYKSDIRGLASMDRLGSTQSLRSQKSIDELVGFKFADLDPLEVARQITVIEFELFCNIKPREFLDLGWMKEDKEVRAPNILRMAHWSNHVIHWLISEVVNQKDLKKRVNAYEKVVQVGTVLLRDTFSQSSNEIEPFETEKL